MSHFVSLELEKARGVSGVVSLEMEKARGVSGVVWGRGPASRLRVQVLTVRVLRVIISYC